MGTEKTKKERKNDNHLLAVNTSSSKKIASLQDNRPVAVDQAILKNMITTCPPQVNQRMALQKMNGYRTKVMSTQIMQFDFSDEQMESFSDRRKEEQNAELEKLKQRHFVTDIVSKARGNIDKVNHIRVGVTFRTDGRGSAHTEHDLAAVRGMNELRLPFRVEAVTLPQGASGEETPERIAKPEDLDGIDMLFIPGAPTANDTQSDGTSEELGLNVQRVPIHPGLAPVMPEVQKEFASKAAERKYKTQVQQYNNEKKEYDKQLVTYQSALTKYERIQGEHNSRSSYELALINLARTRGIPIIAFCAGSWRLLQAFGGSVETLPREERNKHKAANPSQTWDIGHGVEISPNTMLSSITHKSVPARSMTNVNSTHWAVASEEGSRLRRRPDANSNPTEELMISARATGTEVLSESPLVRNSVEAFESVSGAPVMGFQWHPEAYLPGMPGAGTGSREARTSAHDIFRFMGGAAHASAIRRRNLVREIQEVVPEAPAIHIGAETGRVTDTAHGNLPKRTLGDVAASQSPMATQISTHQRDIDMSVIDMPGRIFGGMAAEIEANIDQREARGELSREQASDLRNRFRPEVARVIERGIELLQRHPDQADDIMKEGIRIMVCIMADFTTPAIQNSTDTSRF